MAEPGLVETFRIVFAQKMEEELARQAKAAGKKTADSYEGGASAGLESFFRKIAGWLAAAFAVTKIVDFAKASIAAANESEKAWNELQFSLGKVGVKLADVRGEVEKLGQRFLDKTTFGDEAALRGLNTLVQMTGDYQLSLSAVSVAADLAAAKHMTLEEASALVGKALEGNTVQLKRMGVQLKEGSGVLAQLSAQFKGAAENELNTFGGKVKQLGQFWQELKEAIGAAMIEAGNGTSVMDTLIGVLKGVTTWVKENQGAFVSLGHAIGDTANFILQKLIPSFARIKPAWDATIKPFIAGAAEDVAFLANALSAVFLVATPGAVNATALQLQALAAHLREVAKAAREAGKEAEEALRAINSGTPGNRLGGAPAGTGTSTFGATGGTVGGVSTAVHDRIVGELAAQQKAAEAWKKSLEDLAKALQMAILDAGQATLGMTEELDKQFKGMSTERLEEIRTEFQAKKDALRAQGEAVLKIANEETEANARARDREAEADEIAHRAHVDHLLSLRDIAFATADITDSVLRLGEAWGIVNEQTKKTLESVIKIAEGVGTAAAGIATGNPVAVIQGGLEVIEGIGGLFHKNKDPGRLAANAKWYAMAAAGDEDALQQLFLMSGHADASHGWATKKAKDDAWAKYQAAKEQARLKKIADAGPQAPARDPRLGPENTPEQEARAAADAEALRLRDIRVNEEEGVRLLALRDEQAAQDHLASQAKDLSADLQKMVAAAIAAQRAAELMGETSDLGFASPLFRDAKARADAQFDTAQRAVEDAITKQAEAAAKPDLVAQGTLTPGFSVTRTLTETSANRVIGELITSNVWLERIERNTRAWSATAPRSNGPELVALADRYSGQALLAGNSEIPV